MLPNESNEIRFWFMIRKLIHRLSIPFVLTILFGVLLAIVVKIFNKRIDHIEAQIDAKKTSKTVNK